MECRLSGFTLTISWLSSLSSSAGQCSSATPRSLYEELPFELQNDQVRFELSAASLFRCNSESRLVFAEFLLFFFRSFVRTAAIAANRRQISRSGEIDEWQQTSAHQSEVRMEERNWYSNVWKVIVKNDKQQDWTTVLWRRNASLVTDGNNLETSLEFFLIGHCGASAS